MSSIVVDFEVLPEDGPLERSATQVCGDLHHQLRDPSSILRGGEFARFAAQASLSGGGLQDDAPPSMSTPYEPREGHGVDLGHGEPTPPSPSMRHGMRTEASFPSGPSGGQWGAQPSRGPSQDHYAPSAMNASSRYSSAPAPSHGGGNLQGFSNVELVDRISHLERQLAHTAAGGHSQEPPPTLQRRSVQAEALEEKCHHLQHRLDTLERELRTEQEGHRLHRGKAEQAEQRLKDREQLLVHAKEMWMQENVRASKLAKALTAAEDQLADQERRLTETSERYDRAQQEVRQLQHVIGGSGGGFGNGSVGFAEKVGFTNGSMGKVPSTTGSLAPSHHHFESQFGDDPYASNGGGDAARGRISSGRSLGASAENGRAYDSEPHVTEAAETNLERFRRLCLLNDAVLFEDELLQVGIKSEYKGRDGQIGVYFGNKGPSALQAFTVQYFVKEDQALRLAASPISQVLEADSQVVQRINVTLLDPFVEMPWLRVQYLLPDASPRRIQTRLPVLVTKFMIGRELSQSDYFRVWRQQHFVLNEATAIVHVATRFRGHLAHVARCIGFGGALRLHHGVDSNPDNFVLAGELAEDRHERERNGGFGFGEAANGGRSHGGDQDAGMSVIRVEVGSGRFVGKARIVVRSGNGALARAICDGIVTQLAESGVPPSSGVPGSMAR